jgi:chemotaxis protein CheC
MRLSEILLHRPPGNSHVFGELEQSAIKEAGNILSAAYMNALSDFMGMMLLPSVPSLVIDLAGAVLTTAYTNFGHERDYVFCIQTEFKMEEETSVQGHFLLLPDVESLQIILEHIRLA